MKEYVLNALVCIVLLYIVPTVVSVVFVLAHNKDNPFKADSEAGKWVFSPIMNIICACVIIYYVLVVLVLHNFWKHIKVLYRKFERWNRE